MWFYQFWGTRVCSHLFFGLHNPGIYFNTSGKWQTWAHLFDQFFIIQIWSLKAIFVLWFLRRYPLIDIYKFVYLCKSLQVTKHHCFHIRSSHFKAGGIVNYLLKYTCFRCGTQALTNFRNLSACLIRNFWESEMNHPLQIWNFTYYRGNSFVISRDQQLSEVFTVYTSFVNICQAAMIGIKDVGTTTDLGIPFNPLDRIDQKSATR